MANILTKRKFKNHNKLNKKTKKNKWNRKTKNQIGGSGPIRSSSKSVTSKKTNKLKSRPTSSSASGSVEFHTQTKSSKRDTVANNNTSKIKTIISNLQKIVNNNFTIEIDRSDVNLYFKKDHRAPIISTASINQFFESLFPGNIYIDALENFRDKMQVEHRILFDAKKLDFIDEKIRNAKDKFSVMESLFLQELPLTIYSDHMSDLVNPEQSPFVDKYIQYASNKSFDLQKAYTAKKLSEDQKQPKRQPPAPMNTLIHFYFALKNSYYIFNKIGSKIVSGTHVILIDVENLIISANVDDSGPHITTAIAYKNLRAIIKNLAHIYPNLTFILINHMDSWGDNDLLKEITTNMYIINANCETQIPCEKDDFLLMLLMQYFQETNKCSVITHDNYSWYKRGARDNFIRTTITHEHNNVSIGIHDSQLVKDFAYTLDRV